MLQDIDVKKFPDYWRQRLLKSVTFLDFELPIFQILYIFIEKGLRDQKIIVVPYISENPKHETVDSKRPQNIYEDIYSVAVWKSAVLQGVIVVVLYEPCGK